MNGWRSRISQAAVSAALTVSMAVTGVPAVGFAQSTSQDTSSSTEVTSTESPSTIQSTQADTPTAAAESNSEEQRDDVAMTPMADDSSSSSSDSSTADSSSSTDSSSSSTDSSSSDSSSTQTETTDGQESGTWGTCPWTIKDGVLTIEPGVGSDEFYRFKDVADASSITKVVFAEKDGNKVKAPASMAALFIDLANVTSVDFSGLDLSNAENLKGLFEGCSSLEKIDLSSLDTSKVTTVQFMFAYCTKLSEVKLTGLDTSKLENMGFMFGGCTSLTSVSLSGLDTSNVIDMRSLFSGCESLASVDLTGIDTSAVQIMYSMFSGCSSLTELDISKWDVSSCTEFRSCFSGCSKLKSLDFSNWNTSNATNVDSIIDGTSSLEKLTLGPNTTKFQMYRGASVDEKYGVENTDANKGAWYSQSDEKWYTGVEIESSRLGTADTYTKTTTPIKKKGEIKTRIEIGENAPELTSSNLAEIAPKLLSSDEAARVEAGEDAEVWVSIEVVSESSSDYASFKSFLDGQQTFLSGAGVSPVYDIKLWKKIGSDNAVEDRDTGDNAINLSLKVPEEQVNTNSGVTRTYNLYRSHINTDTYEYSFDKMVETTDTNLSFSSNKFSYYMFNYIDTAIPNPNSNSTTRRTTTTSSPKTTTTTKKTTAKTSDPSLVGMGFVAAVGAAFTALGVRRKLRK